MGNQLELLAESVLNFFRTQTTYVFIAQCLQQEEEDGFEVFIPHSQVVFSRDLQQVHQGALTLLRALVVIGQFLEQVGYQVGVVLADCSPREEERKTSEMQIVDT